MKAETFISMDKESTIALQKIDCNCNDCAFMVRDMERFSKSLELHHKWQLDYFETMKRKLREKAEWWRQQGELKKCEYLHKQADEMKFQFDKKEIAINYGHCSKLNKAVSFIPNVLQLDTQDCFVHRKEAKNE